jgi:hypothetical protein
MITNRSLNVHWLYTEYGSQELFGFEYAPGTGPLVECLEQVAHYLKPELMKRELK